MVRLFPTINVFRPTHNLPSSNPLIFLPYIGVQEGCKVFDNAFAVGDLGLLHALQVTEQQFKDFFYNPTPAFTMANVISIVQKVRNNLQFTISFISLC